MRLSAKTFCLFLILAFQGASQAQTKMPKTEAPAKKETNVIEMVLAQVFAAMQRPHFQLKSVFEIDSENGFNVDEFSGFVDVRFTSNIAIPIVAKSGDSQLDDVAPSVIVYTRNLTTRLTANNTKDQKIKATLNFQNDQRQPIGLRIAAQSRLADILEVQINSIDFLVDGAESESPKIIVNGTCDLRQGMVDLKSNKVQMKPVLCKFKGFYSKADGKYNVKLTYDGVPQESLP